MKNTVILKQNNLCDVSAAVTPFDVFVFSDALTLDKSGKTGTRSKELSLCHKLYDILISISLHPNAVDLRYYKL